MAVYNINITFTTDDEVTDLELGDLTIGVADILNSPQVESPDGEWVTADYEIESFILDLYEDSGDRVWRHSLNPHGLLELVHEQNLPKWNDSFSEKETPAPPNAGLGGYGWLNRLFKKQNNKQHK
jgi:hypothetical protein